MIMEERKFILELKEKLGKADFEDIKIQINCPGVVPFRDVDRTIELKDYTWIATAYLVRISDTHWKSFSGFGENPSEAFESLCIELNNLSNDNR